MTVHALDVDEYCNGNGDTHGCEKDTLVVNGTPIQGQQLDGSDGSPSDTSFIVNASLLRFQSSWNGDGDGQNTFKVLVDVESSQDTWAVTVERATIGLPSREAERPIILFHGLGVDSNEHETDGIAASIGNAAADLGVQAPDMLQPTYGGLDGLDSDWANAWPQIRDFLQSEKAKAGWTQVNLIGHSFGGIVARKLASTDSSSVKTVVMIGTPNGGVGAADSFCIGERKLNFPDCYPGGVRDIQTVVMKSTINIENPDQSSVAYYTLAGKNDQGGCIFGLISHTYTHPNDGCVEVDSAEYLTPSAGNGGSEHGGPEYEFDVTHEGETKLDGPWRSEMIALAMGTPVPDSTPGIGQNRVGSSRQPAVSEPLVTTGEVAPEASTIIERTVQGGATDPVSLTFEGSSQADVYVLTSGPTLSASIGSTALMASQGLVPFSLDALVTNPVDGVLNITNPGTSAVQFCVVVTIPTTRHLTLSAGSPVASTGSPVVVEVQLSQAVAGDSPVVSFIDSAGSTSDVAITNVGAGEWTGTFSSSVVGEGMLLASVSQNGSRYASAAVTISPGDVSVSGLSEQTIDTDGDGLTNTLALSTNVTVGSSGTYLVSGKLTSQSGAKIATAGSEYSLASGSQSVELAFPGSSIYASGQSGPYDMAVTVVSMTGTTSLIDLADVGVGSTSALGHQSFQHKRVNIDASSLAANAVDADGNGFYEGIKLTGSVTVDAAGSYVIQAGLDASGGAQVARAVSTQQLSAGTNSFTLTFDGSLIWAAGLDGPYVIRDLSVSLADDTASDLLTTALATLAYTVHQFAPPPESNVRTDSYSGFYYQYPSGPISIPFAASFPGGSGSVEVWERFQAGTNPFTQWTKVATAVTSPARYVPLAQGNGTYEFYTIAVDGVTGLTELPPASADASTQLVSTPVAWVDEFALHASEGSVTAHQTLSVPVTQSYPSGSGHFELWEEYGQGDPGHVVATSSASPVAVNLGADGDYCFWAIGVDSTGVRETADVEQMTCITLDTIPPTSTLRSIPATTNAQPLEMPVDLSSDAWPADLYFRHRTTPADAWGQWTFYAGNGAYWTPFEFRFPNGAGYYEFYTLSRDGAGNQEPVPASAEVATQYVPQLTSSLSPLASPTSSPALTMPYTAGYPSGSGSVELWRRHAANGQPFGDWAKVLTTSAWPITYSVTDGDGRYEFYTIAVDSSGTHEAVPAVADATVLVDGTPPSVTLSGIPPVISTAGPLTFGCTAVDQGSGVSYVSIYARHVDTLDQRRGIFFQVGQCRDGSFTYDFPYGDAYYEFATVSGDNVGNSTPSQPTEVAAATWYAAPPVSHVNPEPALYRYTSIGPIVTSTMPFDLYLRFAPAGTSNFGPWTFVGSGTPASSDLNVQLIQGDGRYEFYSIAVDYATGAREAAPDVADAWLILDATAPTTSVGPLVARTALPSVTVPFTVSDGLGSGAVSLKLQYRYRANQDAPWGGWWYEGSGAPSGNPATVALAWGQGFYEFALTATDAAGNTTPLPAVGVPVHYTSGTDPSSGVRPLPAFTHSTTISIPYVADFASGSGSVDLYRHFKAKGGSSFTQWSKVATVTAPGALSASLTSGDGTYEFYTIATDSVSGISEAAPASADASVVLDTMPPTSTIDGSITTTNQASGHSVMVTATDDVSGISSIQAYARFKAAGAADFGPWQLFDAVNSTFGSGVMLDFTYILSSGDGTYEFGSVVTDGAGNVESGPVAKASVTLDTVAPASSAGPLPAGVSTTSLPIPYTAADTNGTGVASINLYRRFLAAGSSTWIDWTYYKTATTSPIPSTLDLGDGRYEFYTLACDQAYNCEAYAPVTQAFTVLDTHAASNVSPTIAAFQKASPLQVPWVVTSSGSGLASVELWYRYTAPGATPGGNFLKSPNTHAGSATSGTFSYTATSGDGLYEFYTIAVGTNGTREAAPTSADASVVLDRVIPTISTTSLASLTTASSLDITYTASDNTNGSGLASVELWQRFTVPGGTPSGSYTLKATNPGSTSPQKFTGVPLAADGRYEFYLLVTDKAGNKRAVPSSADTFTVRDTTAPSSTAAAPATTAATSINVSYTINDGGGSGPVSIQLFERYTVPGGTPSGSYTPLTPINSTATSGTFSNVATASDGTYEFYTLATDAAGNVEVVPATADSTTVRSVTPTSNVAATIAAFQKAVPLAVPWVVTSNGGGLSSLELWERFTLPGAQPSGTFAKVATLSSPGASGTFSWTPTTGDGLYEFYTLAVTTGSIREVVPSVADGSTVLDRVLPTASTTALTSPTKGSTVDITYTASDNTNGSGLASVELWQRFTVPGGTPSGSYTLKATNPGTASPQKFTGVALAADGRYEFYTIAVDNAGNRKATPSAETFVVRDTAAATSSLTAAAATSAATINISYTINDGGGSGPVSIQLFERYTVAGGTPSGSYTSLTTINSTATSGTFSNVALTADGRYEFYALAVDAAGNTEAVPGSAKATTIRDQVLPTSAAGTLAALINGTALSVPYTASDGNGSGLAKVDLYYRWTTPGGTPSGSYTKLATATPGAASGTFSVTLGSGAGTYQFYTIATDAAGNAEVAPPLTTPDATTVLDVTAPTSSITAPPSTSSAASISIAYTASDNTNGSGIASVECWYRVKASDGATPGAWTAGGTGTTASGNFTLTFGSGGGIYDVLTVAVDKAGNREGAVANPPAAGATPKSSVRSVTWAASAKVNTDTGTALQDNVAYVVGSDGTVYAVWEDGRNGNSDIYFSSRNPTTGVWAAETKLNADTGSTGQRTPAIAIDGSGNLYVVWADDRNGSTNTDIYFAKRTGTTWSANIKVNTDTGTAIQSNPRISVSSAGIAVAVWYDARSSQVNIYSARLPAGSTTWSTNYNVTTSNTSAVKATPDVAVATDGTAWATWQDNRTGGGDIYTASLGPSATSWSTNTKVSDDSGSSSLDKSPRIGLTSANLPVVAYLDGRTTNAQVRVVNRTSGGTWNASVQVSDSSAKPATGLALAVKADGGVIVAWDDTRSTSAIWGAQCEAGSGTSSVTRCGPAEKWSDQTGASSHPTITASTTQVYLGWRDDTAGGGDIRIRLRNPS